MWPRRPGWAGRQRWTEHAHTHYGSDLGHPHYKLVFRFCWLLLMLLLFKVCQCSTHLFLFCICVFVSPVAQRLKGCTSRPFGQAGIGFCKAVWFLVLQFRHINSLTAMQESTDKKGWKWKYQLIFALEIKLNYDERVKMLLNSCSIRQLDSAEMKVKVLVSYWIWRLNSALKRLKSGIMSELCLVPNDGLPLEIQWQV